MLSKNMKTLFGFVVIILSLLMVGPVMAQSNEIKLDKPQPKITSVTSVVKRNAPQNNAAEVAQMKLGTVVNAVARSAHQDTIAGKTDYWYLVNRADDPRTGWIFGGQLLDYSPARRASLVKKIIDDGLEADNTDFDDRQEIYELASISLAEATDTRTRAEFELLKIVALGHWAATVEESERDKSPYREWLKTHGPKVIKNEFGGGYKVRTELIWDLEQKYHALPVSDRIAWEATQNFRSSDCESDEVCGFLLTAAQIEYLKRHPKGAHSAEAVKNLNQSLSDDVLSFSSDPSGDEEAARQRAELKKDLATLRLVLPRVSAPEKTELMKKLARAK